MARNDPKNINKLMTNVQNAMDRMYQITYYNSPDSSKQLDGLRQSISSNIDKITNFNMNTVGMPSVSKLYSRMNMDQKTGYKDVQELFDDALGFDDFYSNFMQNRYLVEADAEIDAVCKYFPELIEALEIKKESVLCADHFSKDFLTILKPDSDSSTDATFDENCKSLKKTYNLLTLVDEIYDNAAKYGEQFVYHVPYSTALSRLLTDKPNTTTTANGMAGSGYHESAVQNNAFHENFTVSMDNKSFSIHRDGEKAPVAYTESVTYKKPTAYDEQGTAIKFDDEKILGKNEKFNLQLEICKSGVLESVVLDKYNEIKKRRSIAESVSDQFFRETAIKEDSDLKMITKDKKTGKLVEVDNKKKKSAVGSSEGLVTDGIFNVKNDREDVKVDVPGCVVTKLKREQVIPIYMGTSETCLGYYYIELRSVEAMQDFQGYNYMMSDSLTSLRGSNSGMNAPFNVVDPMRQEELIQFLAGQLAKFIDKEFVQANQDLRQEIYMILKHNDLFNTPSIDKIKITFIPPEDITHFYFKLDPTTHRGISDLEKAMVPAKIYASLYITDAIAQLCRGQDKRVFYVKQNVDTNIAQTLMNTIQQIKQGNFGLRQFSNINNVLNITGKFNDFIIPVSASGDSPVQMEVLPGQQFTDNTDRMQALKEMAINSTDVPFEMINTRNSVDYAMQLSMSSSKFLRKIYHRQALFAPKLSTFITKLYNYEYGTKEQLEVRLPPPLFLNMANTNQLVDNTKQFIQSFTEYETAGMEDDKQKNEYYDLLLKYYLGSHLDIAKHEALLKEAIAKANVEKNGDDQSEGY